MNSIMSCIIERRSVRAYNSDEVNDDAVTQLLTAASWASLHELGLGTCWIGEILKNEDEIRKLLGVSEDMKLMAVISVGYPGKNNLKSKRREISEYIINWL